MRTRNETEEKGGIELNGKYSPESLLEKILELDPVEFLGICKIIGVKVCEEETVEEDAECGRANEEAKEMAPARDFYDIWGDVCDTLTDMNRVRRRNLGKLIYAAVKSKKEN